MNTLAASALPESALDQCARAALQGLEPVVGLSIATSGPQGDQAWVAGMAHFQTQEAVTESTLFALPAAGYPVTTVLMLKLISAHPERFSQGIDTPLTQVLDGAGRSIFSAGGLFYDEEGSVCDLTDSGYYREKTGKRLSFEENTRYSAPQLDRITVGQLLKGASGLADILNDINPLGESIQAHLNAAYAKIYAASGDGNHSDSPTALEALQYFGLMQKDPPDGGVPWQSQVTDYCLVLLVIQRVAGQSLNNLLRAYILEPLGLSADVMPFVESGIDLKRGVARRYAYLNADEEIDAAIANGTLMTSSQQAERLRPSYLRALGRRIVYADADQRRPVLDVLSLPRPGFNGIDGMGLVYAAPWAFARFYAAFCEGRFFTPAEQALYEASFTGAKASFGNFEGALGFGGRRLFKNAELAFTTLGGLVLGSEHRILYNHQTQTAVVLAGNFSGHFEGISCLLVVKMPYLSGWHALDCAKKISELPHI